MITGIPAVFDIKMLDAVSVLMPKSKVHFLLERPDEIGDLGKGLNVEIYKVSKVYSMVGTGYIYDDDQYLKRQAFIFKGSISEQTAEEIIECGFIFVEKRGNYFLLEGKDDDTGQPIMVTVTEDGGMTTVITFEKEFYDKRLK